jgi:two-component system, OmpR family, sensor histidine kinase KdpD
MTIDIPPLSDRRNPVAISLAGYAGALLLVAVTTMAGLLIGSRWGNSPVVMLYLLPVLAAAIYVGLGPGLVAAVASTLTYNYFFTAPFHTFMIHSAADIVTVAVLFLVAVVCSQLAASIRRKAKLAAEHAARNATIAGFARRLLSSGNEAEVADVSATQLAGLFGCQVVVLSGHVEAQLVASSPLEAALNPADLAAPTFTLLSGERTGRGEKRAHEADWQFHPVAAVNGVIASVGFARNDGAPPVAQDHMLLLESLLDQMALALERARLDGEARDMSAMRVREQLRSALLTSIGDDIKPRLKAIQSAVRALRRDGTSNRELVAELDSEVTSIERHIDNLVDVSPGAQYETIALSEIAINLHHRTVMKDGEEVHLTPKEFAVLGELAKHAGRVLTHIQLLRAVWGPAHQDHVDYLRVAVRALRQKLERDPASPEMIINEPGVGYRLNV